ncbi:MAG: DUF3126 family protein [Candidatus Liberibacter ctenarytainae]|uniref:DUF3126 family protein n=1 Tax=Candidatus Liberibacter ctenarytainae TaxID=2020335 RepID=A0A937ACV1_9HYPH|nr:DUF3126 family protein [Candidatus Liberibacter ctenarytainae]
MQDTEIQKLDLYLKNMFGPGISAKPRINQLDSAEVFMKSEFIGLVYRDDEEGEVSYNFCMPILSEDL